MVFDDRAVDFAARSGARHAFPNRLIGYSPFEPSAAMF